MNINVETLFKKLASDVGLDSRTVYYCIRRFHNEGIQFFTVTLPKLSKAVLRSLELGYFDRTSLTSFRWKGALLGVFRGLLLKIFCQKTGAVLDNACSIAIYCIRQVCEYMYKLVLAFTPDQEQKAEEDYLSVEEQVRSFSASDAWIKTMRKTIFHLFPDIGNVKVSDVLRDYRPRNTKGSFAGSSSCSVDYTTYRALPDSVVGSTLAKYEGISGFFKPYPSSPTKVSLVGKDVSEVAEVMFVPKDSRGPRVISKEPMHQLRLQMSFFDWFSAYLERKTNKRINFADQSINRRLAHEGSITQKFATIDLKEASDRLSSRYVASLFEHISVLRYFVRNRSTHYRLPSGKTGRMFKLSGMGSGLTFSLLAFVVYVSVVSAICKRVPKALHSYVRRNVYVYGDDLVVPSQFVKFAQQGLSNSGLVINVDKSYTRGYFRESCGGDYYYGNNVTPVRLRLSNSKMAFERGHLRPRDPRFFVLQTERHCRELVKAGLNRSANYLYDVIQSWTGELPLVSGDSPVIGRYSLTGTAYETDDNGNYELVKAWIASPVVRSPKGICPYKAMSHSLKPTEVSWKDMMYPGEGSRVGELVSPRHIRLYRKPVSAFRLCG